MAEFSVEISIPIPIKNIEAACKALESEMDFKGKARIKLKREKEKKNEGILGINIISNDISALHAATGSMLRAIKVILSISDEGKGKRN